MSQEDKKKQLRQMRPTLVVGVGGTGQMVLTNLKAILYENFGEAYQERIRLLAFDTTEEALHIPLGKRHISLEANDEFFDIGDVPVSSIVRNIDSQESIKERLGSILSKLPAGVLRSGSKQLRPFGLMSLLWNYATVTTQLRKAIWQLAGRNQAEAVFTQQQGINVFVCGSMVGGTGSGIILDLTYLIRDTFIDLGSQAEFCHVTGIGLLPQAFQGIKGPNMLPNTSAFLQELNHLMLKGRFSSLYPDGRLLESHEAPFDIFYVIDGVDQAGRTWNNVHAVCQMVAACMYLQMGTQLGQKGENAFDNLDEVLSMVETDGQGSFLASVGKGDLVFDASKLAQIFTLWFLAELLQTVWLSNKQGDNIEHQLTVLLDSIQIEHLRPLLQHDSESRTLFQVDVSMPSWLHRLDISQMGGEAMRYLAEYEKSRLKETLLPQIAENGVRFVADKKQEWQQWLKAALFAPDLNFHTLLLILEQMHTWLREHSKQTEITELERLQTEQEQAYHQMETAVARASTSFLIGRTRRVQRTVKQLFKSAQQLFLTQFTLQLKRTEQQVWYSLQQWVRQQQEQVSALRERLNSLVPLIKQKASHDFQRLTDGGVATISLVDEPYAQLLYNRFKPSAIDSKTQIGDPVRLMGLTSDLLLQALTQAIQSSFSIVEAIGVEQVIQERAEEMSLRTRREQLFQLATPSWNIDRARLPDGGSRLVRLEVLGVPDANQSIFSQEPMLVSTHDPYRVTALVVAAGASPSALQQYRQYERALEQVRGKRPLHILPDFLKTADQGRLLFALGSIFGFVYNQGTFFYYRPADPLTAPSKLANGLSNAIEAFSNDEAILQEVNERVEGQISRLGLHEAIQVLTEYYSNVPNSSTHLDEQLRELKRLVRDYTESLRRIDAFSMGIHGVNHHA